MRIAMISPEIGPFAKTGGLADVVGTLSNDLERFGHELCLIMPAYRAVMEGGFPLEEMSRKLAVQISDRTVGGSVLRTRLGKNISVYLARADRYFDREFLYGTQNGDYPDNAERFTFFSRATLEILKIDPVDIIHCHDWQSALVIVFLNTQASLYPELKSAKTVFTVHNLGFQGLFPESEWHLLNLDRSWFTSPYLEFFGRINLLKGALVFADKITTVSPTYAREIMTPQQGFGLEGVLRKRKDDLIGILNGVDYSQWSPEIDPFTKCHYDRAHLAGKSLCKKDLQQTFGLPLRVDVPMIGMISRLTSQKGFDLVEKVLGGFIERNIQFAVLGSGERRYEEFFCRMADQYSEKIGVRIGFDEALAHQIEAGADIFLMPSLYEPCGLNQMFSLKYGTIPVVRAVGGLKDTVEDYDPLAETGTGFVFRPYKPAALRKALDRALELFPQKRVWSALQKRAMSQDFSWKQSAAAYSDLYRRLITYNMICSR
ncbi:MAG TPA: glycogen synthase GlgA [Candidatus Binatia bacterium]|nr:glycogen synthase GlgA [Candidatus Binatia bacterium]